MLAGAHAFSFFQTPSLRFVHACGGFAEASQHEILIISRVLSYLSCRSCAQNQTWRAVRTLTAVSCTGTTRRCVSSFTTPTPSLRGVCPRIPLDVVNPSLTDLWDTHLDLFLYQEYERIVRAKVREQLEVDLGEEDGEH